MQYLSSTAVTLTQAHDITYKFRPNGWVLVLLYQCLVMTLPALKFLHVSSVSEWSWLCVTLPIWGPSALLALVLGREQLARMGTAKADAPLHSLLIMETTANC